MKRSLFGICLLLCLAWTLDGQQLKQDETPAGLFRRATYMVGSDPVSVAVGDFNGDGKPDIVTANAGSNSVSVLINRGDGTFRPPLNYSTGKTPQQVILGDFNGDGNVDLAVANSSDSSISLLLGSGKGRFPVRKDTAVFGGVASLAAWDLNGDGKLDLVAAPADVTLLGNGSGTFQPPIGFYLAQGGSLSYLIITSLNAVDMVGTENSFPNRVEELVSKGDGTWLNYAEIIPGGSNPTLGQLDGADVNGDRLGDVAVNLTGMNQTIVCMSNADGVLACGHPYDVGTSPQDVVFADLNGDTKLDLITANSGSGNISVLLGNGDGTFRSATNYSVGKGPQSVAAADFNADGRTDLVIANATDGTITVLIHQ